MKASELMSTDLSVVLERTSIDLGEALATAVHVRHMPVVESNGSLVGIVSVRDVLKHYVADDSKKNYRIRDIMTSGPLSANPTTDVMEIADLMFQNNVSCIPIVDDSNSIIGIITERDLVKYLIQEHR